VAGEHVREQSQRERDRPDEDVGHELERDDQQQDRAAHAARHRLVLEVAEEAVLPDADAVVEDPGQRREPVREAGPGERGELDERDQPEQVVDQHQEEQRREVWDELHEVALAEHVAGDAVAHEAVGLLAGVLELARHRRGAAGGGVEDDEDERPASTMSTIGFVTPAAIAGSSKSAGPGGVNSARTEVGTVAPAMLTRSPLGQRCWGGAATLEADRRPGGRSRVLE
jgi:hypothetical protein